MQKIIKTVPALRYNSYCYFAVQSTLSTKKQYRQLTPRDFSRLDIRIGQIIQTDLHPELSTHYCKKIKVSSNPNIIYQITSGSRNHIDQEQIIGKVAIIVNLHPNNLLGCKNEGNVLYVLSNDKKTGEIIAPQGQIGQRIFLQNLQHLFPNTKNLLPLLHSSEDLFSQIFKDLRTDSQGYVNWKNIKLMTKNGFLKSNLKSSSVL